MKHAGRLVGLLVGAAVVEFLALFFAVGLAGAGHGTYRPAKLLFPWSLGLTGITGTITRPLIVLALLQFPAYALAVWALGNCRIGRWSWGLVALVHTLGVIFAFSASNPSSIP